MKSRLQLTLEGSLRARNDRGSPPRSQSPSLAGRADLGEIEAPEIDEADPSRERLGHSPHEVGRRAPQHQDSRGRPRTIGEGPQRLEQPGVPLDLVDDDEAAERSQRELGLRQLPSCDRGLEVEEVHSAAAARDLPGEGRLAALPRPEQGADGVGGQGLANAGQGSGSGDQGSLHFCSEATEMQGPWQAPRAEPARLSRASAAGRSSAPSTRASARCPGGAGRGA